MLALGFCSLIPLGCGSFSVQTDVSRDLTIEEKLGFGSFKKVRDKRVNGSKRFLLWIGLAKTKSYRLLNPNLPEKEFPLGFADRKKVKMPLDFISGVVLLKPNLCATKTILQGAGEDVDWTFDLFIYNESGNKIATVADYRGETVWVGCRAIPIPQKLINLWQSELPEGEKDSLFPWRYPRQTEPILGLEPGAKISLEIKRRVANQESIPPLIQIKAIPIEKVNAFDNFPQEVLLVPGAGC